MQPCLSSHSRKSRCGSLSERTTSVRVASLRSVSSRMSKLTSGWRGSRSSSSWFASASSQTSTLGGVGGRLVEPARRRARRCRRGSARRGRDRASAGTRSCTAGASAARRARCSRSRSSLAAIRAPWYTSAWSASSRRLIVALSSACTSRAGLRVLRGSPQPALRASLRRRRPLLPTSRRAAVRRFAVRPATQPTRRPRRHVDDRVRDSHGARRDAACSTRRRDATAVACAVAATVAPTPTDRRRRPTAAGDAMTTVR